MTEENKEALNVQASENSVAVGNLEVGRDLSGNVNIGGTQTINYYGTEQAENLFNSVTIPTNKLEPETILISAGVFMMGGVEGSDIPGHEKPQFNVDLPAYRIGKFPVTNEQYAVFIQETERLVTPEMRWDGKRARAGTEKHPVTGVTWFDAVAYCEWLKKTTGRNYSLPNEAQWEKACRGGGNTIYPWGDDFDSKRCNHGKAEIAAVNACLAQNDFGCFDLVGNIRQWTCTLWGEKRPMPDPRYQYPWKDDERNNSNPFVNRQVRRVVRGSSMSDAQNSLRCSIHRGELPDDAGLPGFYHGFRVVISK